MRNAVGFLMLLLAAGTGNTAGQAAPASTESREAGLKAFAGIAEVLRHPRCLNCHTTTSFPRQGDDRHPHVNLVRRGADGHGAAAMPCSTCHQSENNETSGVPGKPNWHLAPLSMGWEGLSDGDLCRTLKDPKRNGGRDLHALTEHIAKDPLVAYGWDPGGARRPIPISREEAGRLMEAWSRAGGPCPSPTAAR